MRIGKPKRIIEVEPERLDPEEAPAEPAPRREEEPAEPPPPRRAVTPRLPARIAR